MTIDPAVAVRSLKILTACALGLMVSYTGPAAGASSSYCATHPDDRITTCFLDLTKTTGDVQPVNGGIFVTASAGDSTQQNGDMGIRIQNGSVRLGDIAKVAVCDVRNLRDRRDWADWRDGRCERYYEFLLDANERADGVSLDEFKVLAGPNVRFDLDGGPGGDVSVVTNYNPNGSDIRALIPVSSFAGLTDNTFVYVYSRFNRVSSGCQEGKGSSCPPPGSIDPVALPSTGPAVGPTPLPLPPTALLLGIGVAGVLFIRRRRTPA